MVKSKLIEEKGFDRFQKIFSRLKQNSNFQKEKGRSVKNTPDGERSNSISPKNKKCAAKRKRLDKD
jgi:hypothetical protein